MDILCTYGFYNILKLNIGTERYPVIYTFLCDVYIFVSIMYAIRNVNLTLHRSDYNKMLGQKR